MTFIALRLELVSEVEMSDVPCTLTPGNYLICSDGLSRSLAPRNTPDGIPETHSLDPLRCLVVCVDQPLSDIWLEEAANVKLSITTVWGGQRRSIWWGRNGPTSGRKHGICPSSLSSSYTAKRDLRLEHLVLVHSSNPAISVLRMHRVP